MSQNNIYEYIKPSVGAKLRFILAGRVIQRTLRDLNFEPLSTLEAAISLALIKACCSTLFKCLLMVVISLTEQITHSSGEEGIK